MFTISGQYMQTHNTKISFQPNRISHTNYIYVANKFQCEQIEQTKSTFLLKLIRNCIAENPNSPRIYTRSSLSTAHNSWLDLSKFTRKRFSFNTPLIHTHTHTAIASIMKILNHGQNEKMRHVIYATAI